MKNRYIYSGALLGLVISVLVWLAFFFGTAQLVSEFCLDLLSLVGFYIGAPFGLFILELVCLALFYFWRPLSAFCMCVINRVFYYINALLGLFIATLVWLAFCFDLVWHVAAFCLVLQFVIFGVPLAHLESRCDAIDAKLATWWFRS